MAGGPQRGDQAALVLRPDPPEDAGAVRLDGQLLVVHGLDLQAGQDGARRDADGRGDRGHGRWVVAGDDPQVDLCLDQLPERVGCIRAELLAKREDGERAGGWRGDRARVGQVGWIRLRDEQHPQTRSGQPCDCRSDLGVIGSREDLRGAQQEQARPDPAEQDPGPAALRRERDLGQRRHRDARQRGRERVQGPRSRGRTRADHAQDRLRLGRVVAERKPGVQDQALGRQGAGLVETQRVHPRHRLDGIDPVDDRPGPTDPNRRQRVGDGRHDREPLRDEGDQHGGCLDGLGREQVVAGRMEGQCDRDGRGDGQDADREDERVKVAPERRPLVGAAPRLAGEPARVRRIPHRGDLDRGRSGHTDAARPDEVARPFGDRLGLTRQDRFVHLDRARGERPVHHRLVAALDDDGVSGDEVVRRGPAVVSGPADGDVRPGDHCQTVELALGVDLEHHRDGDVGRHRDRGERGVQVEAEGEQDERHAEQDAVEDREDVPPQDPPERDTRRGPRSGRPRRGRALRGLLVGDAWRPCGNGESAVGRTVDHSHATVPHTGGGCPCGPRPDA